jgi:hypothetical protein
MPKTWNAKTAWQAQLQKQRSRESRSTFNVQRSPVAGEKFNGATFGVMWTVLVLGRAE